MSRFTILLGGDFVRTPRVDAQVAGARVIAADSGMRHAATLGVTPELWIGDFNSVSGRTGVGMAGRAARGVSGRQGQDRRRTRRRRRRSTRGATSLVLAGAFGGPRADHAFLHLALALRLAEAGLPTLLTSGAQEGCPLLPGATRFRLRGGTLFSVLGFSELTGLSVSGARWPLDRVTMAFGSSLTISNEVTRRPQDRDRQRPRAADRASLPPDPDF